MLVRLLTYMHSSGVCMRVTPTSQGYEGVLTSLRVRCIRAVCAQVVGIHPDGYLLCQMLGDPFAKHWREVAVLQDRMVRAVWDSTDSKGDLTSAESVSPGIDYKDDDLPLAALAQAWPTIEGATLAVPLALCPPSMQLQVQQLGMQAAAAGAGVDVAAAKKLYQEEEQPRWEPWELMQSSGAADTSAASAERSTSSSALQAGPAHAAGGVAASSKQVASGPVLDAAAWQSWRQGVLGLWKQPYLKVQLQLLPLEEQQEPEALEIAARFAQEDLDMGPTEGCENFGDELNLLLLARVVES